MKIALLSLVVALAISCSAQNASAEVASSQVMDVAQELACLCGTCPTRPLHECRCGYAGKQRDRIAKELGQGKDKPTIIAGFVSEFGERIYVTPPKEGFNLLAWFMPFFGIALGGVLIRSLFKGWSKKAEAERASDPEPGITNDTDRAKLDAALKARE